MGHCIVVGAGIIGLCTAHRLIQEGYQVSVIDQADAGMQSSWAGGGILSPLHPWRYLPQASALVEYSLALYSEFIEDIKQSSGIDPEYIRSGALFVDHESIVLGKSWAQTHAKNYELLNHAQLVELEPMLAYHQEAILFSDIYQLRPPRLLKALKHALRSNGVELIEHLNVENLRIRGGKVIGVKTQEGALAADQVVVSCGAWTGQWLKKQGLETTPTRPVRGQMLLFDAQQYPVKHLVLNERNYLIPRQDGLVLVGSTMEEVGFKNSTTQEGHKNLHQAALQLMPELEDCDIIDHWAGLRPGSPNGIPTVAAHPQIKGLYVNAGHFRNGVAMAVGSARLLVDLIMGRETDLDMGHYDVFKYDH